MSKRISFHPLGLPLGWQLFGIIIGALIVAQLVTLVLTIVLPPAAPQRWDIDMVAANLLGTGEDDELEHRVLDGPPDISGGGWLVSESSREALAERLDRPSGDVVLAFYTQLPVGGVSVPIDRPVRPLDAVHAEDARQDAGSLLSGLLVTPAHAQAMPGTPPPGGMPAGGFPGGGFPGGGYPAGPPPAGAPPAGGAPAGGPASGQPDGTSAPAPASGIVAGPADAPAQSSPAPGSPAPSASAAAPAPTTVDAPDATAPAGPGPAPTPGGAMPGAGPLPPAVSPNLPDALPQTAILPQGPTAGEPSAPRAAQSTRHGGATGTQTDSARPVIAGAPDAIATPTSDALSPTSTPPGLARSGSAPASAVPIPFRPQDSFLSFTSPPFIEGDFIAAMRQADGTWLAVAPRAEPFPNYWQKRAIAWFALSLLIVGPFIWAFSRRLVQPLEQFAGTAEALGRDPGADVLPLAGPAEIGRAARAFNQMRSRLRAFVDDRTTMIGAIGHDLRTPLTRMRFRLENVPEKQREALLGEVEEMEAMITQVIGFIKDVSAAGPREMIDFGALVETAARDARLGGKAVDVGPIEHIDVEADAVGLRRVVNNLIDNAVKYGDHASVRVAREGENAFVEIVDQGPGIDEAEMNEVFDPFYRCEAARRSDKPGSGLGLAVCRSIARAHGGDVTFARNAEGFLTRLQLPAGYDASLDLAA